jgi:hypothetical protein
MINENKKKHNVTIRFSEEEKKNLDIYAKNMRMSRGQLLRELFKQEIRNKTINRFKYKKSPPLMVYIPKNFDYYEKMPLNSKIDFLTYYQHEPLGKMEYFPLTIKWINNDLDTWLHNGFGSAKIGNFENGVTVTEFEHEGLIIHQETKTPYNYTYLISMKQKTIKREIYDGQGSYQDALWGRNDKIESSTKYFASLITLEHAIMASYAAENEKLYDQLLDIKNNEVKRDQLFETRINTQLKRYKNKKEKPKFII